MRYTKRVEKDFLTSELVHVFELRITQQDIDRDGEQEIQRYVDEVETKVQQEGFEPSGT